MRSCIFAPRTPEALNSNRQHKYGHKYGKYGHPLIPYLSPLSCGFQPGEGAARDPLSQAEFCWWNWMELDGIELDGIGHPLLPNFFKFFSLNP
jgi:hypothetical protein